MRRIWKMMLLTVVMSLAVCLCGAFSVSAEKVSGEPAEGFFWELDTETGILTFSGTYSSELNHLKYPEFLEKDTWGAYEDQIRHVFFDGVSDTIGYGMGKVETASGHINQKIFWEINCVDRTLEITGAGEISCSPWLNFTLFPSNTFQKFARITIGDGLTGRLSKKGIYTDVFEVGKDLQIENSGVTALKSYVLSPQNPYASTYEGCLYSKDFSRLLSCPSGQAVPKLHPDVKIISEYAFFSEEMDLIVLPWGVTTIEQDAFMFIGTPPTRVILPDTVTSMQQTGAGGKDNSVLFTYSKSNTVAANAVGGKTTYTERPIFDPVDSLYEYYPDHVSPPQKPDASEPATGDPTNPSSSPDDAKPVDKPTGGTSKPTEPSKPTEQSKPAETSKPSETSKPASKPAEQSKPASSTPEPSKPASSLPAESSETEISSESSISESAELSESSAESSEESSEEVSRVEAPEVESSGGDFTWLLPIVIALIAAVAVLAVILIRVLKGK